MWDAVWNLFLLVYYTLQYCENVRLWSDSYVKQSQCITIQRPSEVKCRHNHLPLRMISESCDTSVIFIYDCHDTRLYIILQLLDFSSSNQNYLLISFGKGGNFVITVTVYDLFTKHTVYGKKNYVMVHIQKVYTSYIWWKSGKVDFGCFKMFRGCTKIQINISCSALKSRVGPISVDMLAISEWLHGKKNCISKFGPFQLH